MELRLDGKTALVTGASKGIGFAIAKAMAESGAKVMLSSRKQETVSRETPSFGERFTQRCNGPGPMWWQSTAGTILDRWLRRTVACATEYPWWSCRRALAVTSLARGGRR